MVEVFGVSNCSVGVDSCCRNCFRYRSSSGRGGVTNVGCEENSLGSFDVSLSTNDLFRGGRCCWGGGHVAALVVTGL
jgi:hypothetical protein